MKGQSIEIFEIRPMWRQPDKIIEEAVATTTYVKTQRIWKVYWQRADLKWHRYDPDPEVNSLEEFLDIIDRDEELRGQWKGHRSSRLSIQYRIIYKIEKDLVLVQAVSLTPHDYRGK